MLSSHEELPRPKNYRLNRFHLFGRDIVLAGMARPDSNTFVDKAMRYVVETEGRTVLIGLKGEINFAEQTEPHGLQYIYIPITDYVPAPVEAFDAFYDAVKANILAGKQVAVHCGAGDGRTGSAFASLKMRELMEKRAALDLRYLDQLGDTTTTVAVLGETVACTPLVKEAVERIRQERIAPDDSGKDAVESAEDILGLVRYEQHLKVQIKNELMSKQSTVQYRGAMQPTLTESTELANDDNDENKCNIAGSGVVRG